MLAGSLPARSGPIDLSKIEQAQKSQQFNQCAKSCGDDQGATLLKCPASGTASYDCKELSRWRFKGCEAACSFKSDPPADSSPEERTLWCHDSCGTKFPSGANRLVCDNACNGKPVAAIQISGGEYTCRDCQADAQKARASCLAIWNQRVATDPTRNPILGNKLAPTNQAAHDRERDACYKNTNLVQTLCFQNSAAKGCTSATVGKTIKTQAQLAADAAAAARNAEAKGWLDGFATGYGAKAKAKTDAYLAGNAKANSAKWNLAYLEKIWPELEAAEAAKAKIALEAKAKTDAAAAAAANAKAMADAQAEQAAKMAQAKLDLAANAAKLKLFEANGARRSGVQGSCLGPRVVVIDSETPGADGMYNWTCGVCPDGATAKLIPFGGQYPGAGNYTQCLSGATLVKAVQTNAALAALEKAEAAAQAAAQKTRQAEDEARVASMKAGQEASAKATAALNAKLQAENEKRKIVSLTILGGEGQRAAIDPFAAKGCLKGVSVSAKNGMGELVNGVSIKFTCSPNCGSTTAASGKDGVASIADGVFCSAVAGRATIAAGRDNSQAGDIYVQNGASFSAEFLPPDATAAATFKAAQDKVASEKAATDDKAKAAAAAAQAARDAEIAAGKQAAADRMAAAKVLHDAQAAEFAARQAAAEALKAAAQAKAQAKADADAKAKADAAAAAAAKAKAAAESLAMAKIITLTMGVGDGQTTHFNPSWKLGCFGPFTVIVKDGAGRPVPNKPVNYSCLADGGVRCKGASVIFSGSDGVAKLSENQLCFWAPAKGKLTMTVTGVPPVIFNVEVLPAQ
jgi:hypothetical protein